jgi:AsmA protein
MHAIARGERRMIAACSGIPLVMAKAATSKSVPLVSKGAIARSMLGTVGMAGLLVSAVGPLRLPFAETLAKTYYREAVIGLLLVVALVASLVTAVVKLFDPNQFKDQIVRYVHERTQRDLVLDGELTMRYFPKLGIEGGKASLSQRRSAREFASIERARVTIGWLPLLHGRMHVDSVEVDGLKAQLVRFKDGTTNVDDLWRTWQTIDAAQIDVDSLRLANARIEWHDERVWQRGALHDLFIDVGRLADGVPAPLTAGARVDAPVAGIDARLQLKGRLMFDAANARMELARIDGRLEGKALGIDNAQLSARGDVIALPRERVLHAENVVLSSMHKSGLTVFNTVLSAPELKLGEYRLSGRTLSIDASVTHPDRSAALALKLPRFEWAERALRDTTAQAQLTLKSGGALLRAQGSSALALALDGGARLELPAFEMTAQLGHPMFAAELAAQLKGRIDIDLQQQLARSTWTGQLAGSEIEADIGVADIGSRARWTINADLARLDADALLSPAWLARLGDDALQFDVSALRDVQALGRLRIGELKLGGSSIASTVARFEVEQSVLALEPVVAQLHGADVDASVRIDATQAAPLWSLKGSASNLELRGLLVGSAGAPWLEGRGALVWDLNASGASLGSLRHALAGSLNATVRSGTLAGIDLRAALLDGKGDLGRKGSATAREFNTQASTPFSELKLAAQFKEGRALVQGLEMQTGALRTAGEGELVLDTGALDLRLQATVAPKAPAELAPLAGVTVPLHVVGPWRTPSFSLDAGAASGDKVPRTNDAAVAPQVQAEQQAPDRVPVALSVK